MSKELSAFVMQFSPLLALTAGATLHTLLDAYSRTQLIRTKRALTFLTLTAATLFSGWLWFQQMPDAASFQAPWIKSIFLFSKVDAVSLVFWLGIGVLSLVNVAFWTREEVHPEFFGDIHLLTLFTAVGMFVLASSASFLTLLLGLELLSLPLFVLITLDHRSRKSAEAAFKYFLFGGLGSAFFLVGLACVYLDSGTISFSGVANFLHAKNEISPSTILGITLMLSAGLFKVGAIPFHMWVPDVYEGASSSITGFMGSVVKLIGICFVVRMFWGPFQEVHSYWATAMEILAVASMFIGNLAALTQKNLKRMFAYSSIAHVGYILFGVSVLTAGDAGLVPIFYYLLVYGLMFIGFFAFLNSIEAQGVSTDLSSLAGLGPSHPRIFVPLTALVLSAAGIPPMAGFFAKYYIFFAALQHGHVISVILAVITSVIGAVYYLRVLMVIYMHEPIESRLSFDNRKLTVGLAMIAVYLLYFGFFPAG